MPTLSPTYDIKSLIEQYASIQYANKGRPSTSNGVQEYHSNCPWCPGSKDSFIMQPEIGRYSHAIRSSGCGRHGDCIDFLKEYCSMSHAESCEILGLEINGDFVPSSPSQSVLSGNESPPCKVWQSQGMNLVERAQKYLWSPAGKEMLDYLHGRGLGDEIIKKKKLGYVPLQKNGNYYEDSLENWGLDPSVCSKDKVRIPNGILIPWFEGSTLWRLAIKRPNPPDGQRTYVQVVGSGEGLFNVDEIQYDTPAMVVEGEICAMSVEQECGDLVACVATGSTTRGRLNRWVAELGLASYVLQSFDEDESGDNGAEYWMENIKKCMRWSPIVAKDPNDILRKKFFSEYHGFTLKEWVEAGLQSVKIEYGQSIHPPPVAIPPCKVDLLQSKNHLPHWSQKDFENLEKAFSHVHVVGPETDLKAILIQEWKKNCLPCMEQGKQKDRFPPWLITGTDDWKKLVKRVGLEEVNERRQVALSELG